MGRNITTSFIARARIGRRSTSRTRTRRTKNTIHGFRRSRRASFLFARETSIALTKKQSTPSAEAIHRPRGVMLWIQIFVVAFFFIFGTLVMFAGLGSSAAAAGVLIAISFFALALFFLVNLIGFRSQHLTLRDDGISFRLAPLGNNFVLPWKLQRANL